MGAALPPTGIVALMLAGRHLTSTWISFDSRSEGEDSPVRVKRSNYFRGSSFNLRLSLFLIIRSLDFRNRIAHVVFVARKVS